MSFQSTTTGTNPEKHEILKSGSWEYYLDGDDYAHITCFTGAATSSLKIPSTITGKAVYSIEADAFKEQDSLNSVTIPFYVRQIDENAFPHAVTIRAYHGSFALSYAESMGYPSENRSSLDFADGVLDFSEIIRSHYSYRSNTRIEFNRIEASFLEEGSVFFLPASEELPNGDAFKVSSISYNGDG